MLLELLTLQKFGLAHRNSLFRRYNRRDMTVAMREVKFLY